MFEKTRRAKSEWIYCPCTKPGGLPNCMTVVPDRNISENTNRYGIKIQKQNNNTKTYPTIKESVRVDTKSKKRVNLLSMYKTSRAAKLYYNWQNTAFHNAGKTMKHYMILNLSHEKKPATAHHTKCVAKKAEPTRWDT